MFLEALKVFFFFSQNLDEFKSCKLLRFIPRIQKSSLEFNSAQDVACRKGQAQDTPYLSSICVFSVFHAVDLKQLIQSLLPRVTQPLGLIQRRTLQIFTEDYAACPVFSLRIPISASEEGLGCLTSPSTSHLLWSWGRQWSLGYLVCTQRAPCFYSLHRLLV